MSNRLPQTSMSMVQDVSVSETMYCKVLLTN